MAREGLRALARAAPADLGTVVEAVDGAVLRAALTTPRGR
jgi:hypothetical protein